MAGGDGDRRQNLTKRAGGAVLNKKGDAAGSSEFTDLTPTSPTYSENNFNRSPLPLPPPTPSGNHAGNFA